MSEQHTDGLTWSRLHPVTPLVRGWTVVAAVILILGQQGFEIFGVGNGDDDGPSFDVASMWWVALLGIVAIALVAFGCMYLAWRKTSYAIGETDVHLRKGVLFRQQRHARLDRLQAVDIRQPVVARLCGLAELRIEVAGGVDATIVIGFLREEEARQLRAELLARAAGVKAGARQAAAIDAAQEEGTRHPARSGAESQDPGLTPAHEAPVAPDLVPVLAEEAPEQELYVVPPGRLVMSLLRSPAMWIALAVVLAVVVVAIALREPSVVVSGAPAVLAVGSLLFNRFAGEFNFRAALSPDGIRVRRGLLETRAQTIPPGRVQAISLIQGPLWRGPDWWRVRVNVAGYQSADGQGTESVLLPVGTRADALTALWLVLPDLGVDEPLPLLDEGLTGIVPRDGSPATRPDGGPAQFHNAPRRAWIVDPLAWRRDAYAVTSRALLLRRGRLVRRLDVVPHERMQSVAVEQGPLQRRLRVATFTVHSTPGSIAPQVPHLDEADARRLLWEQADRARAARAAAGPERWMERPVDVVAGPSATPPAAPQAPEGDSAA